MKLILVGIITGALMLVFVLLLDLLFDYFGFARSHVVQMAIWLCAAVVAGFISRRIVECKTGPTAESGDS
jgi:hypothetical protein